MSKEKPERPKGSSLSQRILIGLSLGAFTGLFIGDYAGHLAIVGQGCVALLQMSILPYMVVSLIGGIVQPCPAPLSPRWRLSGQLPFLGSKFQPETRTA